jgi:hypothetical protein
MVIISLFLGLAYLLPICEYIDFIEFIPSTRLNEKCHYYDNEVRTYIKSFLYFIILIAIFMKI